MPFARSQVAVLFAVRFAHDRKINSYQAEERKSSQQ